MSGRTFFFLFLIKVATSRRNTSSSHPHLYVREAAERPTKCDQTLASKPHMLRKRVGGGRCHGSDFISFSFQQTSSFSSKDLKQVLAVVKEKEWPSLLSKHCEDETMRSHSTCQCRRHQLLSRDHFVK